MDIRLTSLAFPRTEGQGPITATTRLTFPRAVQTVAAGITGYTVRFEDQDDHHVGRIGAEIGAEIDPDDDTVVNVHGALEVRDWSNEFDDPYGGVIDLALLADLVPAVPPAPGDPRGDLTVVDAEITQVIQHFRSADQLDPPNVFPDNSVRLVADKPTIVRLYTDYDAHSGLPLITRLSGEMVITGNGSTTTILPIESIAPRRDAAIDRGNRRHTLNFAVPEGLCRGTLTMQMTVFNAFDRTQFSRVFEREIRFDNQPALRVMAVGINYTGPDVKDGATPEQLAAPVEADFVGVLDFTESLFPIPEVSITSYSTMNYDENTISDISEGCDKLDDLREAVAELRGDSDDLVYGLFNEGVDTGSVGGCGDGGAGVGRIGRDAVAAHELGHALGRKHVPCDNVTRCAQPLNTDDGYPRYSGFDSDSIGEYGVDPRGGDGRVLSPADTHDIMGYSDNKWISPYTYKALMSAIPVNGDGGAEFTHATAVSLRRRDDNEWIPVKQQKLFLRLDIDRQGRPDLKPSFHFPALPRPASVVKTDYALEFADGDGHVLSSTCLYANDVGCGCCNGDSGALRIRQAVPFNTGAVRMVLARCSETIAEWEIPPPPKVEVAVDCDEIEGPEGRPVGVARIHWGIGPRSEVAEAGTDAGAGVGQDEHDNGEHEASEHEGETKYWSLVQWRDPSGVWRGCVPRTRATEIVVPRSLFGSSEEIIVRVLVTSGIATGMGWWHGPCRPPGPGLETVPHVVLSRGRPEGRRAELPGTIRATVLGARLPGTARIRWYGEDGGELARGRTLDLGALPTGQSVITAAVVGASGLVAAGRWLVERTPDGRTFLLQGNLGSRGRPAGGEEPRRHRSTDHTHEREAGA